MCTENKHMGDLVVRRWARYGHDRLYVQTADGTRLGYWDCKTDLAVVEPGTDRGAFDLALARWRTNAPRGPEAVRGGAVPEQGTRPEASPAARTAPSVPCEPVTASVPVPTPAAPTPAVPGPDGFDPTADLAARRPGAAAREQAVALRRAAPVRTFFARALGVKTDERSWRIGADGEEAVAARLARLGERWKVLHAVLVGDKGSDIDHVVVGPGGVFTVNAKHHPDATIWVGGNTFTVNGTRVPYVRNSRHEATRAARLLAAAGAPDVQVTGLIAVMGARGGWTMKAQPADGQVVVLRRKDLDGWLAARPHVLNDEQVERVFEVARRAGTWR